MLPPDFPASLNKGISAIRENLAGKHDSSQLRTFTLWWNSYLAPRGHPVHNLTEQIRTGVLFVRLIEALEGLPQSPVLQGGKIRMCMGAKLLATAEPINPAQRHENLSMCLDALTKPAPLGKGIQLVNIGAEDLAGDGTEVSVTLVLGLTWEMIKFYELGIQAERLSNASIEGGDLLEWVRLSTAGYGVSVGNSASAWERSFRDGLTLAAMVHSHAPAALSFDAVAALESGEARLEAGFGAASTLGVPHLLEARDVAAGKMDAQSIMTYVGMLRGALKSAARKQMVVSAEEHTLCDVPSAVTAAEKAPTETSSTTPALAYEAAKVEGRLTAEAGSSISNATATVASDGAGAKASHGATTATAAIVMSSSSATTVKLVVLALAVLLVAVAAILKLRSDGIAAQAARAAALLKAKEEEEAALQAMAQQPSALRLALAVGSTGSALAFVALKTVGAQIPALLGLGQEAHPVEPTPHRWHREGENTEMPRLRRDNTFYPDTPLS